MTIIVSGANESIQVKLDAAPATNQLPCSASYADQLASGGDATVNTNGTTQVTLVAAPATGVSRVINGISIPNVDTATRIVTVSKLVSATSYQLIKVTLLAGYQLFYGGGKWYVLDASGALQGAGGGGVTLSNTSPWMKNQYVAPFALTSGATVAIDASLSNNFKLTMTGACKLLNPTNLSEGMVLNFLIDQDATGGRALTFDTMFKPDRGTWPTWATTAGAKSFISGCYDGTIIRCAAGTGY